MFKALDLDMGDIHIIDHIVEQMEEELGTDREAALADMRYSYIEDLCAQCVVKHQETREQLRSEKIDQVLTSKYFGIPVFLLIMLVIFWLTFSVIGAPLQDLLGAWIDQFTAWLSATLTGMQVTPWLVSLIIDGVCAAWAASSPSCRSSCCSSSSCRCWKTAATWRGLPLSWISCCARSAFPAAALCRC